ncbi:LytTR family DNA-binding domain-containing protein [Sulfitobacter sp. G21635-S1]|uniref:LytTR family DNA-binding domain-containing protein n=1 Tax=Sulfitobacter sp. G21635-S1 TaxID=3014043 RepID=UPI0022AF4298|nr:LytTR family DNA-binding domain-containing protein [Sulfitobacter sp. G21635-S1]MCZ4258830.1 LytTR family DNA-binding domain-containing protein [Sulfitobacter sp. G21635-S1]
MHLTHREWQRLGFLVALWLLVTLLCAVAGPFGTHEALGFAGRAAYWAGVVALSILCTTLLRRFVPDSLPRKIAFWSVFALVLATLIHGINSIVFGGQVGGGLGYMIAIVGATVLVANGLVYLARRWLANPQPTEAPADPAALFLRRLPLELRGPLVRIEAQDHYLKIVTARGSTLILMRLGEAVEALDGVRGLQTHRSHWVSLDAVTAHRRVQGRDVLLMSDGAEVPVARGKRDAARQAGLF